MALINCKECSGEVSTSAISCPKCGAPVSTGESEGYKQVKVVIAVIFAIIVANWTIVPYFTKSEEVKKIEQLRIEIDRIGKPAQ
jgi:uncharacterized paraquat-inducible protein A